MNTTRMTKTKTVKAPKPKTVLEVGYRTGQRIEGRRFHLATRKEIGAAPCPGEAHQNAHIDHCMVCLGSPFGYGKIVEYEILKPEALIPGVAIPYNWTTRLTIADWAHARSTRGTENSDAFEAEVKAGRFARITIEEKHGRSSTSSYTAFVLAGDKGI